MRKWLVVWLVFLSSVAHAYVEGNVHVWKSSALQGGNYVNTMLSSAPVIFHTVLGSATVNNAGDSFFRLFQSTGDVFTSDSSTKAFIPLDTSQPQNPGIGYNWDVPVSSHCYYQKQGGALIHILWDWYTKPSYTTPNDKD